MSKLFSKSFRAFLLSLRNLTAVDQNVVGVCVTIDQLICLSRKRERNLLEVLGPGDVIEIPSLLPDIHHKLSCEPFNDCQIGLVSPSELVEGIVGIPFREFNEALSLAIGRWWKLLERHSNFLNQAIRERIAIALLDLGVSSVCDTNAG